MPQCHECLMIQASSKVPPRKRRLHLKRGCTTRGCDNCRYEGERAVRRKLKGIVG